MNYNSTLENEDNYKGTFLRLKFIYDKYLKRKLSFDYVINKDDSQNIYIIKDALQNYYGLGIVRGYYLLCKDIENIEKHIFDWLDKQNKPYFYIYYSQYEYNTYNNVYGLYHLEETGINYFTHYLAKQYAMYKLLN